MNEAWMLVCLPWFICLIIFCWLSSRSLFSFILLLGKAWIWKKKNTSFERTGCLSKHFSTFTVMFEVWCGDTWIQQAYDMSLNSFVLKLNPETVSAPRFWHHLHIKTLWRHGFILTWHRCTNQLWSRGIRFERPRFFMYGDSRTKFKVSLDWRTPRTRYQTRMAHIWCRREVLTCWIC